jgi:energy-coupling factor transporter ATP-binding protein EcfA2
MLTLSGVTKSYGDRVLFADAALQVNRGDRIGLVGPNGAGKSTLFGLILKEEPADDGRINFERDAQIGYLPQESAPVGDESAFEIAMAITPDFVKVRRQVQGLGHGAPGRSAAPRGTARRRARTLPRAERLHGRSEGAADARWPRFPRQRHGSPGARTQRWLGHARASRATAYAGTRPADARRTDQPPRPRFVDVVPGLPVRLLGRHPGHLARSRVLESPRLGHRGNPSAEADPLHGQLRQVSDAARGDRRTVVVGVQDAAEGDRASAGVRGSLQGQGQQGDAGAEQVEADRAHGQDRGAGRATTRRSASASRSRCAVVSA